MYGPALDTMPPLTTQLPASPGDAPTRVFAFGGASLDHAPGAPFAYFTLLQPGQSAVGLSNPTLDAIAGDLAGDLAAHVAALSGGDPGFITVAAMPAPALGEQLLTVNGQPRPYAGAAGATGAAGTTGAARAPQVSQVRGVAGCSHPALAQDARTGVEGLHVSAYYEAATIASNRCGQLATGRPASSRCLLIRQMRSYVGTWAGCVWRMCM